jgi:hypothetical protein
MEKIFRGLYPRTPKGEGEGREKKMGRIGEGRGGEGEEREGKEGEGRRGGATAPQKCLSVLAPDYYLMSLH